MDECVHWEESYLIRLDHRFCILDPYIYSLVHHGPTSTMKQPPLWNSSGVWKSTFSYSQGFILTQKPGITWPDLLGPHVVPVIDFSGATWRVTPGSLYYHFIPQFGEGACQQCPGLTPCSALRDHFWKCLETTYMQCWASKPGYAICKSKA